MKPVIKPHKLEAEADVKPDLLGSCSIHRLLRELLHPPPKDLNTPVGRKNLPGEQPVHSHRFLVGEKTSKGAIPLLGSWAVEAKMAHSPSLPTSFFFLFDQLSPLIHQEMDRDELLEYFTGCFGPEGLSRMTSLKEKPHLIALNGTALNWVTMSHGTHFLFQVNVVVWARMGCQRNSLNAFVFQG